MVLLRVLQEIKKWLSFTPLERALLYAICGVIAFSVYFLSPV